MKIITKLSPLEPIFCFIVIIYGRRAKLFMVNLYKNQKNNKKMKKTVDKRETAWYNNRVAARKRRRRKERSLKIEQQRDKYKANKKCEVESRQFKELKYNSNKSKRATKARKYDCNTERWYDTNFREFDPGSGWTLAACITHSSRTVTRTSVLWTVADGWVTRKQPALVWGITSGNRR